MIALYIRLSAADQDLGEEKEESNSVTNQRLFLNEYVHTHPEWKDEPVEEFVDDGYSGMTFDRPAFQQMLALIKQRKINIVIVKDFSRFGRDYIEVGDYMERFFPFMGVRFIAVNEHYDSDKKEICNDQDLGIVMKNILNAYYSRDLSEKITSTIRKRLENGEFVYAGRPYGYMIDPKESSKTVIDPVAGAYARLIFDLALQGKKPSEIAAILNERKIPTCLEYNRQSDLKGKCVRPSTRDSFLWKRSQVTYILRNEFYHGVFYSNHHRRIVPGHKEYRTLRPNEVTRFEDHHPKIVTDEEFEQAQLAIRNVKEKKRKFFSQTPLQGKVKCGNCGRTMSHMYRKVVGSFFRCPLYYEVNEEQRIGCTEERIQESELELLVLRELKQWFQILYRINNDLENRDNQRAVEIKKLQDQRNQLQNKLNELQRKKLALYERYSEGTLTAGAFVQERDAINRQAENYKVEISAMTEEEHKLRTGKNKGQGEFEQLLAQVRIFNKEETLTRAMTDAFLSKVIVYDPEHIEIIWKWQDAISGLEKGDQ